VVSSSMHRAGGVSRQKVVDAASRALERGALLPIETTHRVVEDGGVRFIVRVVESLARKDAARRAALGGGPTPRELSNPFLPYDEDLFVADVSDTHVCLLNKFNVLDHHLLLVTRAFEDQELLLTGADFAAIWSCLAEVGGLGFYNGGEVAGASQPHRHLQLVELPLALGEHGVPIEPLLEASRADSTGVAPSLPFKHALAWLDEVCGSSDVAGLLHETYLRLVIELGLAYPSPGAGARQRVPYNLLVTDRWMLVVPRSRERFEGISINALGFAGALLVRDTAQLAAVERIGPMAVLRHVGA